MECLPESTVLKYHPDTLEVVRKMFNLDQNKMTQSIDLLEEWALKQEHFMVKQFDRGYLERRIITCKGSVEKAKSMIDKLCTLRTLCPKYFICEHLKEKAQKTYDQVSCVHLPVMTKDYQRIFMVRMFDAPNKASEFIEFYRFCVLIAEYEMVYEYTCGYIFLFDMRNVNMMEILNKINLIEVQQFATIIIEGYGARVAGLHFIHESKVIDMFVKVIKPVLPQKIANRIHTHQTLDTLYQFVERELLPSDLGGQQKSTREIQAEWIEAVTSEKHLKHMEEMVKMRTDESLRHINKFNDQCLGLPGSFRTLTVD